MIRARLVALRLGLGLAVLVGLTGCTSTSTASATSTSTAKAAPAKSKLPPIRHVFVIMLENEGYSSTFGDPSNDPYLATTLRQKGAFLENYYAIGHFSLDNYVAFVSGQPPNSDTEDDCIAGYDAFPASQSQETWNGASGIQEGTGCVYPAAVQTIGDQLVAGGYTWKAYMEDMGNDPSRDGAPTSVCGHPNVNSPDHAIEATSGDGYATRHDPFVYFTSVTGSSECASDVVPLGSTSGSMPSSDSVGATGLVTDLSSISTTPNFSFITPNLCDDGHDYPCVNETSPSSSALGDIDNFLSTWVPIITSSPAFKHDGLLEVTFDEGSDGDTSSCCGESAGPTGVAPGQNGPGGGRIGTILISPYIKHGLVVKTSFNHYSSLASIEDLFGLPRLGNAQTVTTTFDNGVFSKSK